MDKRVAQCLLLSKVLTADGIMTENERAFLDAAMKKLEIAPADRQKIIDLEGWADAEAALSGLPTEEKQAIVSQLVDAASADGRLSPLEVAMVKGISAALGLE